MNKLESKKDIILDVEYDLFSVTFKELKDIMLNEYKDIDFNKFNCDSKYKCDEKYSSFIKGTGVICNYYLY
jgi:hypothetical protein